ncbi:MAG: T9SS type A sorting domain-containing protein [Saprospiraceae bacterium]|nr:T9SS type A sorting domain-containing protein [Saprospiraceae bacterium]
MKKIILLFTLTAIFSFLKVDAQVISIDSSRSLSLLNDTVTISGIITNGSELGPIRYIQDPTGGTAVYSSSFNVVRGDSVTVTGINKIYNALLELDPMISYTVHTSGAQLPLPKVITPNQVGEYLEGQLVRFNGGTFSAVGTFSGGTNYTFTAGGQSIAARISNGSSLVGAVIPTGVVSIVGLCSQYLYNGTAQDTSGGYQILLRDTADIISGSSISMTSSVSVSNLSTTGFDLDWTTNSTGTTEIFYGSTEALGSHMTATGGVTSHSISITGATASQLFYIQAFSVRGTDTAFAPIGAFITKSVSSGDIKVYFTSSVENAVSTGTNAIQLNDAIDDTLIAYIDRAQESIDITIYNFNLSNISNISAALNNAYTRGVDIRLIHDGEANNLGVNQLNSNINVVASPVSYIYPSDTGIMHNKFVVFDVNSTDPNAPIVWTGATNWTDGQINTDANNVIIVQDKSLAITYTIEFEEMWGSSTLVPSQANARFGYRKTDNTPHEFIIGGKRIECYFSPSDAVNSKILNAISSANTDLIANTMLITRTDIAYAIQDRYNASVNTKVIVNSEGGCTPTVVNILKPLLGSDFKEYGEPGILHNKTLIVDHSNTTSDPLVLTGCHNWSSSADARNDENTLIIHDSTIANIYYQEFVKRWNMGAAVGQIDLGNDTTICGEDSVMLTVGYIPGASYLWSTGDTILLIYVDSAGIGLNSKSFWLKVTEGGFSSTDTIVVTFEDCHIGIDDISTSLNAQDILAYPNPSDGKFNIEFTNSSNEEVLLNIYDLSGRIIFNKNFKTSIGLNKFEIDANINPGIYILNLKSKENSYQEKLIVY